MAQSLEWPSLQDRRKVARLANLFKIRNNDLFVTAAKKRLVPSKSKHIHPAKYKHVEARTEIYQNSYFPRTVVDWNALPPTVIEAPTATTPTFKKRLKEHLYQHI